MWLLNSFWRYNLVEGSHTLKKRRQLCTWKRMIRLIWTFKVSPKDKEYHFRDLIWPWEGCYQQQENKKNINTSVASMNFCGLLVVSKVLLPIMLQHDNVTVQYPPTYRPGARVEAWYLDYHWWCSQRLVPDNCSIKEWLHLPPQSQIFLCTFSSIRHIRQSLTSH